MRYQTFHTYCIGASHVKKGLPCQDRAFSETYENSQIAIVSDGHGNRRHFRSETGASLACVIALECIKEYISSQETSLEDLKKEICVRWWKAVAKHIYENSWTEEELAEQKRILKEEQYQAMISGYPWILAYGCTLCAVFTKNDGWVGLQIGDGALTVVDHDGSYRWPMPESKLNEGNRTASLCSRNPLVDFRHVEEQGTPAALLIYTDGIEKTFPSQGKEITSFLHWVWCNRQNQLSQKKESLHEETEDSLTKTLRLLSEKSRIGDDMSIAGIVDLDAEDAEPKETEEQTKKKLSVLESKISELNGIIAYNQKCLRDEDPESEAAVRISEILQRKQKELELYLDKAQQIRSELHIEIEIDNEEELSGKLSENPAEEPVGKTVKESEEEPVEESVGDSSEETAEEYAEKPFEKQKDEMDNQQYDPYFWNEEPVQTVYEFLNERTNEMRKKIRDIMEEFRR